MKLYEKPVNRLRFGHRNYRLRLTFRTVLVAFDIANDAAVAEPERVRFMLRLLVRGPVLLKLQKRVELLKAILALITPEQTSNGPELCSFVQDAPLIRAAFWQAYHIDLSRQDLPWQLFVDLFAGLPEGTRFSEVVELRARPTPKPTKHNAEERAALMRAKARVALIKTEKQVQQNYQRSANHLTQALLNMARR